MVEVGTLGQRDELAVIDAHRTLHLRTQHGASRRIPGTTRGATRQGCCKVSCRAYRALVINVFSRLIVEKNFTVEVVKSSLPFILGNHGCTCLLKQPGSGHIDL